MKGHEDLNVWQKAMNLTYGLARRFPESEAFSLVSQMQRAAVSIPSNIAEGHALKQTQAYVRHLAIASGSLAELQTQLEIAKRLGYISPEQFSVLEEAREIRRMLAGLRKSLSV